MSNAKLPFPFASPILALVCLFFGHAHAQSDSLSADLDPARIGWSRVDMSASKMLLSMRVTVDMNHSADPLPKGSLRNPLKGQPVPTSGMVTTMNFDSEGLGRRSVVELLLNSANGAALQRSSDDSGSKQRRRIYRFTDSGAYRWTWKPMSGEEDHPADSWSDQESEMRVYSAHASHGPVTDAGALIYLVAASGVEKPGDYFEVLAFSSSSDEVQRVRVELVAVERGKVNYKEVTTSGKIRHKKRLELLRIRIAGVPGDSSKGEEFELLGLQQVELLIDPVSRAPLELSGKVPFFGRVTFSLDELTPAD